MLYVCLTFDWEGEHFYNILDFKKVMDYIGNEIPVTHFICPAYFTRNIPRAEETIKSIIKDSDEVGLHIHCYKSLIRDAGIPFRTSPDYYNHNRLIDYLSNVLNKLLPQTLFKKWEMFFTSGRGVPLGAYDIHEIEQIINYSKALLLRHLNRNIATFRAGGWLANDDVYEALINTGILIDSSAVPPEVVGKNALNPSTWVYTDDYGETYPVFSDFVSTLWGNTLQSSGFLSNNLRFNFFPDPISHDTFSMHIKSVKVHVNNFGMSDFITFNQTIKPWLDGIKDTNEKDYVINYGCHQEGDLFYKKPVIDLVRYITERHKGQVKFITLSELDQLIKPHSLSV